METREPKVGDVWTYAGAEVTIHGRSDSGTILYTCKEGAVDPQDNYEHDGACCWVGVNSLKGSGRFIHGTLTFVRHATPPVEAPKVEGATVKDCTYGEPAKPAPNVRTVETYASLMAKLEAEEGVAHPTCKQCRQVVASVNQDRKCFGCHRVGDHNIAVAMRDRDRPWERKPAAEPEPFIPSVSDWDLLPGVEEFGS